MKTTEKLKKRTEVVISAVDDLSEARKSSKAQSDRESISFVRNPMQFDHSPKKDSKDQVNVKHNDNVEEVVVEQELGKEELLNEAAKESDKNKEQIELKEDIVQVENTLNLEATLVNEEEIKCYLNKVVEEEKKDNAIVEDKESEHDQEVKKQNQEVEELLEKQEGKKQEFISEAQNINEQPEEVLKDKQTEQLNIQERPEYNNEQQENETVDNKIESIAQYNEDKKSITQEENKRITEYKIRNSPKVSQHLGHIKDSQFKTFQGKTEPKQYSIPNNEAKYYNTTPNVKMSISEDAITVSNPKRTLTSKDNLVNLKESIKNIEVDIIANDAIELTLICLNFPLSQGSNELLYVELSKNDTILQLKKMLGKEYSSSPNCIRIFKEITELPDETTDLDTLKDEILTFSIEVSKTQARYINNVSYDS